jgi:hypothetical protein
MQTVALLSVVMLSVKVQPLRYESNYAEFQNAE